MNVGPIVAVRLARRDRTVHVSRNIDDVGRLRHVWLRGLFDHGMMGLQQPRRSNSPVVREKIVRTHG